MVRMRITKSKRNSRRSHHGVAVSAYTTDTDGVRIRHRASRITGMYRGRSVLPPQKPGKKADRNTANQSGDEEKKTVEQAAVPK